jgi:DNA processing protein
MNSRAAYIALNMMEGIGPVKVRALVEALSSVEAIFEAGLADLVRVRGLGARLAESLVAQRERLDPEAEEQRARRLGARVVTFLDEEYPAPLRTIHDPPLALYCRGAYDPADRHAIAVVGSRRTSHYGQSAADRLAYQLAKVGFTVISGLARGIDTAAHRGALKAGGRTVAVLGSALDRLYPPENAELAGEIERSGCVMSEFPLGTEPGKTTFPMRNRIVSGLSEGLLVVEAGLKSGALITAHEALEQGRHVFAVPGRIDTVSAKGCHALIKQGARLVDDVDDILEEFEFLIPPETKARAADLGRRPRVDLTAPEEAIVRALWEGPLNVDALCRVTHLTVAQVSSHLIGLEMKRVARMLPGRLADLADGVRDRA